MSILVEPKLKKLNELVQDATKEELIWINGYLAGIISGSGTSVSSGTPAKGVKKITLLFGTETGNAKRLANQFTAEAKKHQVITKLAGLDQYKLQDLEKEELVFILISTQGEGEPPASAKKFYDHLHTQPLNLSKLRFGVLALGDSAYPLFCQAGIDVDRQLEKLGASRALPLQMCDVDFESTAAMWFALVFDYLNGQASPELVAHGKLNGVSKSGKHYYHGQVTTSINLNDRGSNKTTKHIEISCLEQPDYEPGDSLGLIPHNRFDVITKILDAFGLSEDQMIAHKLAKAPVRQLLTERLNIYHLSSRVKLKLAELLDQNLDLQQNTLEEFVAKYPIITNLGESVILALEGITPRLYSISSSPAAHEGEVHLTVGLHTFKLAGDNREGHCSGFLCDLEVGDEVTFYIHRNHDFKLPAPDKDVIMIGPGTGIAPFRSFLAERDMTGASGRNWLFFGDQHFTSDFLYQTELQAWFLSGHLSRLNVAFSRDQDEKIYVQHKMQHYAAQLYEWLEAGAFLYVCGARDPMSNDVEKTLLNIISEQGQVDEVQAQDYLDNLKNQGRYNLDVY